MTQNSINHQITNGRYNITIANNLNWIGNFASTYNIVGTTNVTFPVSGTLLSSIDIGSTVQGYSGQLASFAALSSNGIVVRIATGSIMARTLVGTNNRTTITNGDGVAGNPTIDISSVYAGQSTITTLGTIGTGTWQGNPIAPSFGGTGVNNGTSTITLAGSLTLTGAFTTQIQATANTSVTLPVSGLLLSANNNLSELTNFTQARTNLGLGTIATQNANTVAITGGSVSNVTLTAPILGVYTETFTSASSGTAYTFNVAAFNNFVITLTANCTFSLSGVPAANESSITIILTQDTTGSRAVIWPASVIWPNNTAPTLSTAAGNTDVITMITTNGGTTWRAFPAGLKFNS